MRALFELGVQAARLKSARREIPLDAQHKTVRLQPSAKTIRLSYRYSKKGLTCFRLLPHPVFLRGDSKNAASAFLGNIALSFIRVVKLIFIFTCSKMRVFITFILFDVTVVALCHSRRKRTAYFLDEYIIPPLPLNDYVEYEAGHNGQF